MSTIFCDTSLMFSNQISSRIACWNFTGLFSAEVKSMVAVRSEYSVQLKEPESKFPWVNFTCCLGWVDLTVHINKFKSK